MQRRDAQGGYVLVALLASSAIMLATLALAIPRMAVQSQRVKEETLVYRGKQYQRAIELYFREHKKYPKELDDLEDTDGVRYLRKRYKDPLTGEDEWRMIHVGADGRFKDSVIYDLAEEAEFQEGDFGAPFDRSGVPSGFGAGGPTQRQDAARFPLGNSPGLGSGGSAYPANQRGGALPGLPPPPGQFQGGARARAVRQSAAPDQTQQVRYNQGFEFPVGAQQPGPGGQVAGAQPAVGPDGQPIPRQPDYRTMLPSQMPMHENRPRPPDPNAPFGQQQPGRPGLDPNRGQRGFGGGGIQPSTPIGVQPPGGLPGYGAGSTPGRFPVVPGRQPVAGGGASTAFGPPGAGAGATSIIQRLLTTPRPGGLASLQDYGQSPAAGVAGDDLRNSGGRAGPGPGGPFGNSGGRAGPGGAAAFQEGIAGVASTVEDFGVKTYEGREMYNEWEFVYDYRKDMGGGMGLAGGGAGAPASGRTQGAGARGLGLHPGMTGGIAPTGRQARTAPRPPALEDNRFGGFGLPGGQAPGTASRPGYGYGAQPSGAGPYQPTPNSPYRPTGTPLPYGAAPGEPPPGVFDPSRPDGPQPPYPPPAPNADPRKR